MKQDSVIIFTGFVVIFLKACEKHYLNLTLTQTIPLLWCSWCLYNHENSRNRVFSQKKLRCVILLFGSSNVTAHSIESFRRRPHSTVLETWKFADDHRRRPPPSRATTPNCQDSEARCKQVSLGVCGAGSSGRPCRARAPRATSCGGAPMTSRRDLARRHSVSTWRARAPTRRVRDHFPAIGPRSRAARSHWPPGPRVPQHRMPPTSTAREAVYSSAARK